MNFCWIAIYVLSIILEQFLGNGDTSDKCEELDFTQVTILKSL